LELLIEVKIFYLENFNFTAPPNLLQILGVLANDQTIILLIFLFVIFAFVVILIICYIYRRISRPTKKKEIFYPIYRNQSYGLPIRHAKEPKERITTYETLPYEYG